MANHDYTVVVQPLTESDGGGWIAFAPDLPGCVGDGDTPETAVSDLLKAIEEWIDETRRLGREVPAPGDCVAKEKERRERITNLVKAQEALIKQQEQRLKEQDGELKKAKQEIDRIKASIAEVPHHGRAEPYISWVIHNSDQPHVLIESVHRAHHRRVN